MNPETGARFSLELVESAPEVRYALEVELPGRSQCGACRVDVGSGQVEIQVAEPLPAWLQAVVVRLLRSLWRARTGPSQAEPWPRRLTRWRAGHEEAGA